MRRLCPSLADMPTALLNVRSQGQSGKHMLALGFSAFDPTHWPTVQLPAPERMSGIGGEGSDRHDPES
jgi:hypothetical protein